MCSLRYRWHRTALGLRVERDKELWSGPYSDGGSHRTHGDSDNKNSSLEGGEGSRWEQAGRRKEVVGTDQGKLSSPETSSSDSLTCWVGDTATAGRVWTGRYSDWTRDAHTQVMRKQVMFAIGRQPAHVSSYRNPKLRYVKEFNQAS